MGPWIRAAVLLLAGCDAADPAAGPWDPSARALLDRVRADDYETWPEVSVMGDAPHGTWSIIYANPIISEAQDGAPIDRWPDGALVVCEGRSDADGVAESIQIMERDRGGWTWAQFDGDGEPTFYGSEPACSHCHATGDDYLWTFSLPEE